MLTAPFVLALLPLAAVAASAFFLGMSLRDRVDAQTYQRWLRNGLIGMAAVLIVQFVSAS